MTRDSSLLRGTSIVAALTLLSRILGFARDVIVAGLFGAGAVADAFVVAFRIPNLLRSVVGEGALSSAFVPLIARSLHESPARGAEVYRIVAGFLLLTTTVLSALGILFAEEVVRLFAPGFSSNPDNLLLCAELNRIMFPYIIFVSYVALMNGALSTVKIFGAGAVAQVIMNIVLILGGLVATLFPPASAIYILAWSVLIGGVVQVLAQTRALHRGGFQMLPLLRFRDPALRELLVVMLPAILGAAVYQFLIFANTVMASLLPEGAVSWLFYADRVVQLPLGVFSIALASALLPDLSRSVASGDTANFDASVSLALRMTSVVIIPVSFALVVLAEPLTALLFQRGAFNAEAAQQTARIVQAYTIGLWAQSCFTIMTRAFIAHRDTVTTTVVSIGTIFVSVLVSALLIGEPTRGLESTAAAMVIAVRSFAEPLTLSLAHIGLASASSLASIISMLVLGVLLCRRFGITPFRGVALVTAKTIAAAALAAAAASTVTLDSLLLTTLGRAAIIVATFHLAASVLRISEYRSALTKLPFKRLVGRS